MISPKNLILFIAYKIHQWKKKEWEEKEVRRKKAVADFEAPFLLKKELDKERNMRIDVENWRPGTIFWTSREPRIKKLFKGSSENHPTFPPPGTSPKG